VSPGLRKFRAAVYFYSASTTGGITTSTRTRQLSGDEDGLWWVSRGTPTGHEPTVGMKPEERMDSILGLLYAAPWELGHVNLFSRKFERVETWVPALFSTAQQQALAFARVFARFMGQQRASEAAD
jgi:hypothetical protein